MTGQPARSPLPRSAQPYAAEPDVHHITVQRRRRTILGEQRDLLGVLATLVKCFDGPAPRRSLAIVDLAQIQHVPLHRSTAANPAVLYDTPVAMLLTVLAADLVAQNMPRGFRSCVPFRKPLGRHRRRLRQIIAPLIPAFQSLTSAAARENPWNRGSVAKVGLTRLSLLAAQNWPSR